MKNIYTLSVLVILSGAFLTSCGRSDQPANTNQNFWLSKERGEVVYSDSYCRYFVVETFNGYTIIQAYGSYRPYEGAVLYGDFSNRGTKDMYNQSSGVVFTGTVTDYWLSYIEAQDAIDYYCPYGKGTNVERKLIKSSFSKD